MISEAYEYKTKQKPSKFKKTTTTIWRSLSPTFDLQELEDTFIWKN